MMLTAAQLMTSDVLIAHASWSVTELTDFLGAHGISGAPVVSDEGLLVGVVSLTDIVKKVNPAAKMRDKQHAHDYYIYGPAYAHAPRSRGDAAAQMTVGEIMTLAVHDVPAAASATEIAELMIRERIHRVFVTESGMVIGVVTAFDMLRAVR